MQRLSSWEILNKNISEAIMSKIHFYFALYTIFILTPVLSEGITKEQGNANIE